MSNTAYRIGQSRLLVDLDPAVPTIPSGSQYAVAARESVEAPKRSFALSEFGSTWAYLDNRSQWRWINPGGDWINAAGTPQATTNPHLTFTANAVTTGNATYTVNATTAVRTAQEGNRWLAMILINSGGSRNLVTQHHTTLPAPRIEVQYQDGSTGVLQCTACTRIHASLSMAEMGQPLAPAGRVLIEFEKPAKPVTSATMYITVDAHTATASTQNGFLLNPNVNTEMATTGFAVGYPGDEGIGSHPSVLFHQSYPNGTTIEDRTVAGVFPNTDYKNVWDRSLWGGTEDLTMLPTAFGGKAVAGTNKWLWKQYRADRVSIVPSTYTGDGFVPSAPGRGAMRVRIPGTTVEDGGVTGNGGSLGADMWALFPKEIAGLVTETYVRFKMRIGSQPKRLSDTKMVRAEAGDWAYYAIGGGKWGIGAHHWTKFGGNNNVGGKNLGWSNRLGFTEAPVDLGQQGFVPYVHSWDNIARDMQFGLDGLGSGLYPDIWYDIEIRLKLNTWNSDGTPSPSDGICQIWIDGRLAASHTGFKYRDTAMDPNYLVTESFAPFREMGAMGLCLNHYNGGVLPPDHDVVIFYDGVVAATERIGPLQLPEAPSGEDDDHYTVAHGESLYAGWPKPVTDYPWATDLPSNTWVQQTGMQKFYDFMAGPNGANQSGYRGTNPLNSVLNAYCDPAIDPETGDQYFYGGGHGDGTCNAIVVLRAATLTWEVIEPATPTNVYLPQYLNTTGDIFYPSGAEFSGPGRVFQLGTWFLTEAEGLNPVTDAGYIAPKLARASTHMYQAAVYRKSADGTKRQIHYFYNGYGCYDIGEKKWSGHMVNLEAQLSVFRRIGGVWKIPAPGETGDGASLTTSNNVWGVSAMHDPVTDRGYFFVTGGGYRNCIAQFNYDTKLIEAVYALGSVTAQNASFFCKAGRKLYVFANEGTYPKYTASRGFIFDFDTKVVRRFNTTGDAMPAINSPNNQGQETIPGWYDSKRNKICRWNYSVSQTTIHELDLTPVSGSGTHADPDMLTQTARTVAVNGGAFPGPTPNEIYYVFGRLSYLPGPGVVHFIPRSDSGATNTGKSWALKLS